MGLDPSGPATKMMPGNLPNFHSGTPSDRTLDHSTLGLGEGRWLVSLFQMRHCQESIGERASNQQSCSYVTVNSTW